jgi:deoxyribonuclease V
MRSDPTIAALDVDYRDTLAVAAGVWFRGWDASITLEEISEVTPCAAEYEPGQFFRRELPCLYSILLKAPMPDVVIVDGYVWLGEDRQGLGAHLYRGLEKKVTVIGVAKTRFVSANAVPVLRGKSQSPLYVTAAGMDAAEAARCVAGMHGEFRIPTMLKRVDRLTREVVVPSGVGGE